MIVAVDGPAGSGKSSVSRQVARHFGYGYLDTGAAYRALTWLGLRRGTDPEDAVQLQRLIAAFDYRQTTDPDHVRFSVAGEDVSSAIRSAAISSSVSAFSARPEVRARLIDVFHHMIEAEERPGIVVEGRDITTVVAPDAPVRVLLTADPAVRAARRAGQTGSGAARVAAQVAARDRRDAAVTAFLKPAEGVTLLDTTDLNFEQSVTALESLIDEAGGSHV